ncbi:MAG TPA: class I SAM-dependent methyltransferase [Gaiellaceae bacterium]|jgi:ubiquinone/menaquinone biosynthesis C-methylase UbiE
MKAYYEARAHEYDDWWLGRGLYAGNRPADWHEERERLVGWIQALRPARTLDVACGTGFMTRHLRGEVVGLDQSESMIEVASQQAPEARFVQGDALDLPFEDGAFDRLFTSYFYCHLEEDDRVRFLAEARRVASELVVVGTILGEGEEPARWDERVLKDGTRWKVFKRVFVPEELAEELGGRVLHRSRLFVMVASP